MSRDNDPFPLDKFEFVIRVNLIGTFNMLSRAAAQMSKQDPLDDDGGRGAIVNLASAAAFDGQIGQCAYSASKQEWSEWHSQSLVTSLQLGFDEYGCPRLD